MNLDQDITGLVFKLLLPFMAISKSISSITNPYQFKDQILRQTRFEINFKSN